MKLLNPKWAGQKVESSEGTIEIDKDGLLECPESLVQAMLNSGFKKLESAKKPAKKAEKKAEAPKKIEEKVEEAPAKEAEPTAEKPKKRRKWKRSEG